MLAANEKKRGGQGGIAEVALKKGTRTSELGLGKNLNESFGENYQT